MRFKIGLAALTFLAASSTAFATNMPVKKSKAPAVTVTPKMADAMPAPLQPAFSWAGPYIGASAGYGFGAKTSNTDYTLANGNNSGNGFSDAAGILGGLYIGNNWQIDKFIVGGELSGDIASLKSNKSWIMNQVTTETKIDRILAFRVRAGYAIDKMLIYGFGGVATTNLKLIIDAPLGDGHSELSNNQTGYTVGAGIEYAVSNQWIGRFEYSYYDFGKATYTGKASQDVGLTASAVRGGLAYKF